MKEAKDVYWAELRSNWRPIMTNEEMKTAIHKTELDICPDDRPGLDPVRPLAHIVAEMIERSHWAHSGISFEVAPGIGSIFFKVGVKEVWVSGYNLAFQVKLCVDLFSSCGYFS